MSIRTLLLTLVAVLSTSALAEPVAHLYQVREPAGEGVSREVLLGRALDTLILRLTGRLDAPEQPALSGLRGDPQQLVSQFGFEGDGEALVVEFDAASSERALRQAGLLLWGANRPLMLVWWLEEGVTDNHLLSDGQPGAELLQRAAQHRGLPIRLPIGDLNEQLAADASALAQAPEGPLAELSDPYAADVLLTAVARREGNGWQADWRLAFLDQREQGRVSGADQAAVADALMLTVLQRLAAHFVAAPGAASDLEVWIEGTDLDRFAELERLLDGAGARLVRAEGERLVYQVRASAEQLRAQLGLLRLQEVTDEPVEPAAAAAEGEIAVAPVEAAPANRLRFRW